MPQATNPTFEHYHCTKCQRVISDMVPVWHGGKPYHRGCWTPEDAPNTHANPSEPCHDLSVQVADLTSRLKAIHSLSQYEDAA